MNKAKYYAYLLEDNTQGIVNTWSECESIVKGKKNIKYKSFKTLIEAEEWLKNGASYNENITLPPGIYFDAGTGRRNGVEISVTDENGKNLLDTIMPKNLINSYGKHLLKIEKTNNYGELLALKYAIEIAIAKNIHNIFGDSSLILNYWSKGFIKKDVDPETISLAKEVSILRYGFEKQGGSIQKISGDHNPADLGFH